MAVVCSNHQGGTRSCTFQVEIHLIQSWLELHVPALSTVYIPGIENWVAKVGNSLQSGGFQSTMLTMGHAACGSYSIQVQCEAGQVCFQDQGSSGIAIDALVMLGDQFSLNLCLFSYITSSTPVMQNSVGSYIADSKNIAFAQKNIVFRHSRCVRGCFLASSSSAGL